MKTLKMIRMSDQRVAADPCWVTSSILERIHGLMFRKEMSKGSGMLIEPCNSIHTFFMRFAIDVVYLDANYKVLRVRRNVRPWRLDFPLWGARAVLELPAGAAEWINEGDLLCTS